MKKQMIMKYRMMTILSALLCIVTVSAQSGVSFQSTSSMQMSESRYRSAAVTGTYMADEIDYIGTAAPRRADVDDPFGGTTIVGTENPNEPGNNVPIGDGVWVLLLLAGAYLGSKKLLRKAQL